MQSKPSTHFEKWIIRRKLKRGEISKIADATGYSISYVSRVLDNQRNNDLIFDLAKILTLKRK